MKAGRKIEIKRVDSPTSIQMNATYTMAGSLLRRSHQIYRDSFPLFTRMFKIKLNISTPHINTHIVKVSPRDQSVMGMFVMYGGTGGGGH